jgi:hypothetical protein
LLTSKLSVGNRSVKLPKPEVTSAAGGGVTPVSTIVHSEGAEVPLSSGPTPHQADRRANSSSMVGAWAAR